MKGFHSYLAYLVFRFAFIFGNVGNYNFVPHAVSGSEVNSIFVITLNRYPMTIASSIYLFLTLCSHS